MVQTGDLSTNDNSTLYDDELEQGVKSFQSRFGIATDGVIGQSFIKEINTPVEKRIEQIIVNMERSRWVPVSLTKNYVVINIPEFKLHVFENDSLAWSMNVVVGQPAHKTVIFNGDIKYIVFSPYWNVPTSIKNNEILPCHPQEQNYLASHNMEYYDGGNIRQKPGPNNSLGLVKFYFPIATVFTCTIRLPNLCLAKAVVPSVTAAFAYQNRKNLLNIYYATIPLGLKIRSLPP